MDWIQVPIGQLGDLICGQSSPAPEVNTSGRGVPYFTGPEQWSEGALRIDKWTEAPRKLAPNESIFITVKGAGVGKMFPGIAGAIGRDIYAFQPSRHLDYRFVFYALKHSVDEMISRAKGDIPGLSRSHITEHKVSLPGKSTQQRIVAKIEALFSELDNGIENLETARKQLEVYRQAVLRQAFEGTLTAKWRAESEAPAWQAKTLGEVFSFVTSGSRGWAKFYAESGDLFIRAQNLKFDRLDLTDRVYVRIENHAEGKRTRVARGDLLVTITGANVTKTAVVASDPGVAYVSQHVALCRPIASVYPEFLYWFLIAETAGRRQLNKVAYGAGKPGLNLDNIRSVEISLPSTREQEEIATRLNQIMSRVGDQICAIKKETRRAQALRQSILKKAFSGQLVPQDPDDEPASALLARIRAERAARPAEPRPRARGRRGAA